VNERNHSRLVTAIVEPECEAYIFNEMHDYLYSRGFTIYPGKLGGLKTFRIANMGAITHEDMEAFLAILEEYLTRIGFLEQASGAQSEGQHEVLPIQDDPGQN
jgi:2-aminoethylphosphonate-pyruvate transaminase